MAGNSTVIRSVIMPLAREALLLPGSMVAEIVPYTEPEAPPANAPAWLRGEMPWRGQRLPLVSMEAFLHGDAVPAPTSTTRVVVLKTLSDKLELQFYGVVTSQVPQLVAVQPDNLVLVPDAPLRKRIAADVLFEGRRALIPDIDALETGLWAVLPGV